MGNIRLFPQKQALITPMLLWLFSHQLAHLNDSAFKGIVRLPFKGIVWKSHGDRSKMKSVSFLQVRHLNFQVDILKNQIHNLK